MLFRSYRVNEPNERPCVNKVHSKVTFSIARNVIMIGLLSKRGHVAKRFLVWFFKGDLFGEEIISVLVRRPGADVPRPRGMVLLQRYGSVPKKCGRMRGGAAAKVASVMVRRARDISEVNSEA